MFGDGEVLNGEDEAEHGVWFTFCLCATTKLHDKNSVNTEDEAERGSEDAIFLCVVKCAFVCGTKNFDL